MEVSQKRMIREVMKYYVSIGNVYEDIIKKIIDYENNVLGTEDDSDWLMHKIMELFESKGVTAAMCLENKDVISSAVKASANKDKGEVRTPETWVEEAHKMLDNCIEGWKNKNIWDACSGNGVLTKGISGNNVYLSTINNIEVDILKTLNNSTNVFNLDFTSDVDLDDVNSMFTDKLPESLKDIIKNDKGLVFIMNPPHKSMNGSKSDLCQFMKDKGYGVCANDSLYQFMYRILALKNMWGMEDVYVGIFGNTEMFIDDTYEDIMSDWMNDFKYMDGMCINRNDYDADVDWNVTFSVWRARREDEDIDELPLTFKAKAVNASGSAINIGDRVLGVTEVLLEDWVKSDEIIEDAFMPAVSEASKSINGNLARMGVDALGQVYLDSKVNSQRKAVLSSYPISGGIDITNENMIRCLVGYAVKACCDSEKENSEFIYKPLNEDSEAYKKWVADSIVLSMFDYSNIVWAYRDVEVSGFTYNRGNFMFPFKKSEIESMVEESIIADKKVIKDIESNDAINDSIIKALEEYREYMSNDAIKLLEFGKKCIEESFYGKLRRQCMFGSYTVAWDASLSQIRTVKNLWGIDKEKKLVEMLSMLKDNMRRRLKEVGFIRDTEYID